MVNIVVCPRNGEGRIIATPCYNCRGDGVRQERTLVTVYPPAIDSGSARPGGPRSAAGRPARRLRTLVASVRRASELIRRGTELYYELPVTFAQAALGVS